MREQAYLDLSRGEIGHTGRAEQRKSQNDERLSNNVSGGETSVMSVFVESGLILLAA
jgi:hypothetical protein